MPNRSIAASARSNASSRCVSSRSCRRRSAGTELRTEHTLSKTCSANSGPRMPPSQEKNCASTAVVMPFTASSDAVATTPYSASRSAPRRGAIWRSKPSPWASTMPGSTQYPVRSTSRATLASWIVPSAIVRVPVSQPCGVRTFAPCSEHSRLIRRLRADAENADQFLGIDGPSPVQFGVEAPGAQEQLHLGDHGWGLHDERMRDRHCQMRAHAVHLGRGHRHLAIVFPRNEAREERVQGPRARDDPKLEIHWRQRSGKVFRSGAKLL